MQNNWGQVRVEGISATMISPLTLQQKGESRLTVGMVKNNASRHQCLLFLRRCLWFPSQPPHRASWDPWCISYCYPSDLLLSVPFSLVEKEKKLINFADTFSVMFANRYNITALNFTLALEVSFLNKFHYQHLRPKDNPVLSFFISYLAIFTQNETLYLHSAHRNLWSSTDVRTVPFTISLVP